MDFKNLSITQLHQAYESGSASPVEVVEAYLQQARVSDLGTWVTLCEGRALRQAQEAYSRLEKNGRKIPVNEPLFGVPMGLKDNLCLKGVRTTCASKILENYIAPYTATSVERLEQAGAIILGKLNLDEFAMGGSNENSAFGPVKNPNDHTRVSGGSSGGAAASVKAGECLVSLGSDTGGSVRLPASYCGVVGFKPTYGRVSRSGLVAFASSLDQIGTFGKTVADAARVFEVISGPDSRDSTSAHKIPKADCSRVKIDFSKIRVGVPQEFLNQASVQPEVEQATQSMLEVLKKKGATVVPVSIPHLKYSISVYYIVAMSEASSNLSRYDGVRYGVRSASVDSAKNLQDFYEKNRRLFGAEVKRRILLGTFALSSGYADEYFKKACQVRRLIQQDFIRAFEKVDFLLSPVAPTTAFKLGEKSEDPLQMYLNDLYTIPANLVGLPALSLPWGEDTQGLPIGVHFLAATGKDESLLALASELEGSHS